MSGGTGKAALGPRGWEEGPYVLRIKNVTAATTFPVGRVVQLDLAKSDGDTTSFAFGKEGTAYANAILPVAGATGKQGLQGRTTIFAVCQESIAAGAEGVALAIGKTKALALNSAAGNAVAPGDELVGTTAGNLDVNVATGGRVLGRLEIAASGTQAAAALLDVYFNGVAGATR